MLKHAMNGTGNVFDAVYGVVLGVVKSWVNVFPSSKPGDFNSVGCSVTRNSLEHIFSSLQSL